MIKIGLEKLNWVWNELESTRIKIELWKKWKYGFQTFGMPEKVFRVHEIFALPVWALDSSKCSTQEQELVEEKSVGRLNRPAGIRKTFWTASSDVQFYFRMLNLRGVA